MQRLFAGGIGFCLIVSGCAVRPQAGPAARPAVEVEGSHRPEAVTGVAGMEKGLFRDGRVYIGGQPTEESLASLSALGVRTVINLRTPSEMSDPAQVPFEEAAEATRLGMEYVTIPIGGKEFPYSPGNVEAFARVLERRPGLVLLHCRSGGRASYLWTAYLIRYGGLGLDAALAHGRAIAIGPDPLELLLGQPITLEWAGPTAVIPTATPPPH